MKLKEELFKKIRDDEIERNSLENQLAKVEKAEMKLLKIFRKDDEEEPFAKSFEMAYNSLIKPNSNNNTHHSEYWPNNN